jgi:hypothetical protein
MKPSKRFFIPAALLTLTSFLWVADASAREDASLRQRVAARRNLSIAKNNLRYYWQVEYPRQRRDLDMAVELTEMELKNLNTQLREFRPFTQFSIGQPFPLTVRSLQMCIKATELRLDNLRAERNALIRFHSDDFNALAAEVFAARMQVLALEPQEADAASAEEQLPPQN